MILVCGEALVDLFVGEPEPDARGEEGLPARAVPGGSPFNLARGLARLGCPAAFFGALSRDRFGRQLAAVLERDGVELRWAPRSDRPTTLALVTTGPDGEADYDFRGEGAADRLLGAEALPKALPETVRALAFGSYSLAVDPAGETYLALAEREAGRRLVSLDPNLRPAATPDLARWRRRFERFLATADLVKASSEDLALAYGPGADPATIAARWLRAGPCLVVVTRGAEGAVAFSAGERVEVPGRAVALRDSVGAGDSFHAALLARLAAEDRLTRPALAALDRTALATLLHYAVAAASLTCEGRGAVLPTAAAVAERLGAPPAGS